MNRIRIVAVFFISIVIIFFVKCSEGINNPDDSPLTIDFNEIGQQLERSYRLDSQRELDMVFAMWQNAIPPFKAAEREAFSDTVRQIYEIFEEFYCPEDLKRITGGYHENLETKFRYIVAQNSVNYTIVDTNPQFYFYKGIEILKRTIPDFRPQPKEINFPVVYLSASADSMIYKFLYQSDGTPEPDHQKRVEFLRKAMQLTHHHWIGDYHKATMPIVSTVYIDKTLTQALVLFRVFYQFGNTYMERSDNRWRIIYSKLTAIE